ncbi:hypothetical protein Fmac_020369 [Flemingia macrophylla]|uniref:EF-hand domain-containing protein n=1 Tax=Flemingia macrophylla TaxID=520843 RepID=A0ABD1LTX1_9FABA
MKDNDLRCMSSLNKSQRDTEENKKQSNLYGLRLFSNGLSEMLLERGGVLEAFHSLLVWSRTRMATELEEVFKKFDVNINGKILALELGLIMGSLGIQTGLAPSTSGSFLPQVSILRKGNMVKLTSEDEILNLLDEDNVIGSGSSRKVYRVVLSSREVVVVKKI